MNKIVFTTLLILISSITYSQTVLDFSQECIKANKDRYGKIQKIESKNDTIILHLSTYGPCDVKFLTLFKNLEEHDAVNIQFNNEDNIKNIDCACMFDLKFTIIGIDKPKSKKWITSNKTMTLEQWEKWYWDNL